MRDIIGFVTDFPYFEKCKVTYETTVLPVCPILASKFLKNIMQEAQETAIARQQ